MLIEGGSKGMLLSVLMRAPDGREGSVKLSSDFLPDTMVKPTECNERLN